MLIHHCNPLDSKDLLIATKFFAFLFFRDDWAEKQDNVALIVYLDQLIEETFNTQTKPDIDDITLLTLLKCTKEDSLFEKTKSFFSALLSATKDTVIDHFEGFKTLNSGEDGASLIGFDDLKLMTFQHLEATEEETDNRLNGYVPSEEKFNKKRVKTSAVEAVYVSSVLTSGVRIPKSIRNLHRIQLLEDNLGKFLCRFNAFISAYKEINTPNWVSNNIHIVYNSNKNIAPNYIYSQSVAYLCQKINDDMYDTKKVADKLLPPDLDVYRYAGLVFYWSIGSLPAQMVSGRYHSDTRAPYVPEDKRDELRQIDGFWSLLEQGSSSI